MSSLGSRKTEPFFVIGANALFHNRLNFCWKHYKALESSTIHRRDHPSILMYHHNMVFRRSGDSLSRLRTNAVLLLRHILDYIISQGMTMCEFNSTFRRRIDSEPLGRAALITKSKLFNAFFFEKSCMFTNRLQSKGYKCSTQLKF